MDLSQRSIENQQLVSVELKKKRHLYELSTWERDTVMWHESAVSLFCSWQFYNMDVQYQVKHRLDSWTPKLVTVAFHIR